MEFTVGAVRIVSNEGQQKNKNKNWIINKIQYNE